MSRVGKKNKGTVWWRKDGLRSMGTLEGLGKIRLIPGMGTTADTSYGSEVSYSPPYSSFLPPQIQRHVPCSIIKTKLLSTTGHFFSPSSPITHAGMKHASNHPVSAGKPASSLRGLLTWLITLLAWSMSLISHPVPSQPPLPSCTLIPLDVLLFQRCSHWNKATSQSYFWGAE